MNSARSDVEMRTIRSGHGARRSHIVTQGAGPDGPDEGHREDLVAEATALVRRAEFVAPAADRPNDESPLVAGFRRMAAFRCISGRTRSTSSIPRAARVEPSSGGCCFKTQGARWPS
ncbi:MAG: hypothetical protein Ct9H300mP1_08360 [Planctomycetaceae bacterium]|nr:MAG: hypothetical protein Ct9H300mP1_08360 [Planctomycetaceae bacterium]